MPGSQYDQAATFPRLLLKHAAEHGDDPATREKDLGIWQTWTWRQVAAEVRALACGLAAQGFERGMHLAIIGDNRPRLYWSMIAAQALGGVPVPMYQDAPAAEFVYVLNDASIVYAVVEDQEQVDKMVESAPQVPSLAHIYYDDPRGLRNYEGVTSLDRLLEIGREFDRAHPEFFDREVAKGRADDVSVMLYTSGTTGKPKGVCQTHNAFIVSAQGGCQFDKLGPHDSILSYLPMAWVGRPSFFVRAMAGRGLHHQLPGVRRHGDDRSSRDRADVLLRAAASVREPAHAGDDPHGGRECDQALAVPVLHGGRAALRRRDPRRQAVSRRSTASATRSATSSSTDRCATCWA